MPIILLFLQTKEHGLHVLKHSIKEPEIMNTQNIAQKR